METVRRQGSGSGRRAGRGCAFARMLRVCLLCVRSLRDAESLTWSASPQTVCMPAALYVATSAGAYRRVQQHTVGHLQCAGRGVLPEQRQDDHGAPWVRRVSGCPLQACCVARKRQALGTTTRESPSKLMSSVAWAPRNPRRDSDRYPVRGTEQHNAIRHRTLNIPNLKIRQLWSVSVAGQLTRSPFSCDSNMTRMAMSWGQ